MSDNLVRSRKEVMRSLFKRAVEQERGSEIILLLQWIKAKTDHQAHGVSEAIKAFDFNYYGQPQSVRMLNVLAERENKFIRFLDSQTDRTKVFDNSKFN